MTLLDNTDAIMMTVAMVIERPTVPVGDAPAGLFAEGGGVVSDIGSRSFGTKTRPMEWILRAAVPQVLK